MSEPNAIVVQEYIGNSQDTACNGYACMCDWGFECENCDDPFRNYKLKQERRDEKRRKRVLKKLLQSTGMSSD
jgi:transcription initiation factor IIE alpha subunit